MSKNFLRFKRKFNISIILKALLYGLSAGLFVAGILLILARLEVIGASPLLALPVGIGTFLIVGVIVWLCLHKNDRRLACEIDKQFALDERVETMIAFQDVQENVIYDLQREDAERALGQVPLKQFKIKRLWICCVAFVVGIGSLLAGFLVKKPQPYIPPEVVVPFELSQVQRAGLETLIAEVKKSEMEEPYRTSIADELETLLTTLENTTTQPDMQVALATSMAYILEDTCNSSLMTEIAEELWDTKDDYAKSLAKVIDTSLWKEPDWGDFAEKYTAYRALYAHVTPEGEPDPDEAALWSELKWKMESSAIKIEHALALLPPIERENALYEAIDGLVNTNVGDGDDMVLGFTPLIDWVEYESLTYVQTSDLLNKVFDLQAQEIFDAISVQKVNTNVGEYAMTKLSTLFLVPLPTFERPDLSEGDEDDSGEDDKDNEGNEGSEGGIGGGAVYGSDDYVLNPMTGEYVKYGTLLSQYYGLLSSKLENGNYTEEQKEAIIKYFDLLFSGLKKDEGK